MPMYCDSCGDRRVGICEHCKQTQFLKYHEWKTVTKNGFLPFICPEHADETCNKYCINCKKNKKVKVVDAYSNFNTKYICNTCIRFN